MTFREYLLEQVHLEKYIPLIKEIVKDVIDSCTLGRSARSKN
jgi:hypothetical protein